MKYPTSDLIFEYTHEPLDECVYKENSSHEWDISQYATRTHCITYLSHASYIRTELKINPNSLQNETTSRCIVLKLELLNVTVSGLSSPVFFSD